MRSVFSAFFALGILLCCSADAFQKTCAGSRKPGGSATSHGRVRRRTCFRSPVKRSHAPKPSFYGVKTDSIDAVIKAQAAGDASIYVNGKSLGSGGKSSCNEPAAVGTTLKGGEVISFIAEPGSSDGIQGGPIGGLFAAIFSADGSKVYATAGQAGWKATRLSQVTDGWMLPGYDDSDWGLLKEEYWQSDCNIDPFAGTGAMCTWLDTWDSIAVRFTVPRDACKCNEGACDNGSCHNCIYHQDEGRDVCYTGWTEDACENAGDGYVWCGVN